MKKGVFGTPRVVAAVCAAAGGILHLAVDMTTAGFIVSRVLSEVNGFDAAIAVVLYNLLAFGLQPLFGILIDCFCKSRTFLLFGAVAVIGIVSLFCVNIWLHLVILSIANAAFHVSAADVVIGVAPHRASYLGVFVAFGAIGLALGTQYLNVPVYCGAAVALVSVLLLPVYRKYCDGAASRTATIVSLPKGTKKVQAAAETKIKTFLKNQALQQNAEIAQTAADSGIKKPSRNLSPQNGTKSLEDEAAVKKAKSFVLYLPLLFLLAAVFIRGLVGGMVRPAWQTTAADVVFAALAIAAGKALGGIFADKFGAVATAVVALIPSAFLLAFAKDGIAASLVGFILFNAAMPVTLFLTIERIPRYRAFAFGLTASCLMLGSAFTNDILAVIGFQPVLVAVATLIGALCIAFGGIRFVKRKKTKSAQS